MRRPGVEWVHSVQDAAAMVRDYVKWDDTPVSLAALRRVGGARLQDRDDAARWSRCVLVADGDLQEAAACQRSERCASRS